MLSLEDKKKTITSLELLEQINFFRWKEGNKTPLRHDNLRAIIKDEFEEEILSLKIQEKPISSNGGRPIKVYILTYEQGKQVLMRESKFVRKAVIEYIQKLERSLDYLQNKEMKLLQRENKLLEKENEVLTLQNNLLKEQNREIEESPLKIKVRPREKKLPVIATKKGLIKRIAQNDPSYFSDNVSYEELYTAFERKFRIDLSHIPKVRRKLQNKSHYIERELKMLDEFLEVAIELYPKGFEKVKELYNTDFRELL